MSSRKPQIGSLLLLFLVAVQGWAQTAHYAVPAASVQDQFAAYHQVLSSAADNLLAAGVAPPAVQPATSPKAADKTPHVPAALLRQFARQYWNGEEDAVRRAVDRVTQLRSMLEPILREAGVPPDVAAIVLVESGGRPTALSPKGARGLWQFMPETARRYGLVVSAGRDERVDVLKSTQAAASYLRDLYSQFGDWQLALAAYNAGEQTVQRAVDRSRAHGFSNLIRTGLIPAETRDYVPAVLSAVQLLGGRLDIGAAGFTGGRNGTGVLYAEAGLGQ